MVYYNPQLCKIFFFLMGLFHFSFLRLLAKLPTRYLQNEVASLKAEAEDLFEVATEVLW